MPGWTVGRGGTAWAAAASAPPPTVDVGPVSVASLAQWESATGLALPDKNYVTWSAPQGTDLHTVLSGLGANDVLVLPENETPYTVGQMYRTSDGTANGANPQTDRSACRSRAGIIGLGPNAIVAPAASFPTYAAQTVAEGARESIIENWTSGSIHANFTVRGKPGGVGGLAYHLLRLVSDGTVHRMRTLNHFGFKNYEPGETFGIVTNTSAAASKISLCDVDGRNLNTGAKEGSGGIHLVRGGPMTLQGNRVRGVRGHGLALWCRGGVTTVNGMQLIDIGTSGTDLDGRGVNLEVCGTNDVTLNDVVWDMRNDASGNPGAQIAVVSASEQGSGSGWPLGRTKVYVNRPSVLGSDTRLRIWTNPSGSGTYAGVVNRAQPDDVITEAGVVRRDTGFGVTS